MCRLVRIYILLFSDDMFPADNLSKTDHNYNCCICGGVSDDCLSARQNDDHVPSCHVYLLEIMQGIDILEELNDALLVDRVLERRCQLLEKLSQLNLQDTCQVLLGLFWNDVICGVRTLFYDEVRHVIYKTIHRTK